MLTKKWFKRTTTILILAIAMIATTTISAMAAAGPPLRVIVVHIADGSGVTPADQEPDGLSVERVDFRKIPINMVIEVDQHGVSAWGIARSPDGTELGGWGAGPDGVFDEQQEMGDTAVGLLTAGINCQDSTNCHVILVNYRQPTNWKHRVAAKAAAEELEAAGHKLHAVAVGPDGAGHVGFNWYLSGQAFSAEPGEAAEMVTKFTDYVFITDTWNNPDGQIRSVIWDNLSQIEKIWLNPKGCDLKTQWLWASDASCHDK